MDYTTLLSPHQIGLMEVKNRLVVPAMATNFANRDGSVSEQMINYYAARAKGGFGLIIVEVAAVCPRGKAVMFQSGMWSDEFIPGWRKLVNEVRRYGAKVAVQLHHAGRQTSPAIIGGAQPVAPSAIACPVRRQLPHALSVSETHQLIDQFAQAALRAAEAGFDAIEFNGAHGYLIAQFMSQYANKRSDEFGGDFEGRMKFATEIVRRVRRQLGNGFPLIFRLSGEEKVQGGRDLEETLAVARLLEQKGVDALNVSVGTYASLQYMSGSGCFAPGYNVYAAEAVKQAVCIPVITAGRINQPALAEEVISSGKADFVAIGRGSIADPEFANKVAGEESSQILPCVACLQGCIGYLFDPDKYKISCLVNPFVGREGDMAIKKAVVRKKVVVVGAGPAGLEAAWIAARRGHQVVCYEKQAELGGQLRLGAIPTAKADLLGAIKYYVTMGHKYGVEYKLGSEFTAEMLQQEKADVVILATGAVPLLPPIKGIHNPTFLNAIDVLDGKFLPGDKVLVVGGGLVGAETAEFIAERGSQVTVIELMNDIARDVQDFVRMALLQRLKEYQVECLTGARVKEFLDDGVIYEWAAESASHTRDFSAGENRLDGFDSVVLAMGAKSYNPLEEKLQGRVPELYVIGDALKAGKAITAIADAARIAVSI